MCRLSARNRNSLERYGRLDEAVVTFAACMIDAADYTTAEDMPVIKLQSVKRPSAIDSALCQLEDLRVECERGAAH